MIGGLRGDVRPEAAPPVRSAIINQMDERDLTQWLDALAENCWREPSAARPYIWCHCHRIGVALVRISLMDVTPLQTAPQVAAPTPVSAEQQAENRQLIQAVRAVNSAELFGEDSELTFAFDRPTRSAVIRLVNRKTRKEIRQVPAEELLSLAVPLEAMTEDFGS